MDDGTRAPAGAADGPALWCGCPAGKRWGTDERCKAHGWGADLPELWCGCPDPHPGGTRGDGACATHGAPPPPPLTRPDGPAPEPVEGEPAPPAPPATCEHGPEYRLPGSRMCVLCRLPNLAILGSRRRPAGTRCHCGARCACDHATYHTRDGACTAALCTRARGTPVPVPVPDEREHAPLQTHEPGREPGEEV